MSCKYVLSIVAIVGFAHAARGDLIVSLAQGATQGLADVFTNSGFPDPIIVFTEDEDSIDLSIISGGAVDSDSSFSVEFISTYWRGAFSFSQANNTWSSDSLTVSGSIYHHWKPHPEDDDFGKIWTYSLFTTFGRTIDLRQDGREHPPVHGDLYSARLTSVIDGGARTGNMTGWTYSLVGEHNVPEPSTLLLLAGGGLAFIRRARGGLSGIA